MPYYSRRRAEAEARELRRRRRAARRGDTISEEEDSNIEADLYDLYEDQQFMEDLETIKSNPTRAEEDSGIDMVEPENDYTRDWFCSVCPVVLSESKDMRVLIPCGHTLCEECAEEVSHCPVTACHLKIEQKASPMLQQGDPIEPSTSDKPASDEKIKQQIEAAIKDANIQLEKISTQRHFIAHRFKRQADITKTHLKDVEEKEARLKSNMRNLIVRVRLAEFLASIEDPPEPTSDGKLPFYTRSIKSEGKTVVEEAPASFILAAQRVSEHLAASKTKLVRQKATAQIALGDIQKRDIYDAAIRELLNDCFEDDIPAELWQRFQTLHQEADNTNRKDSPAVNLSDSLSSWSSQA